QPANARRRARGRRPREHLPDGHVHSGQRPRVHPACGGHFWRVRSDLPLDASVADGIRRGSRAAAAGVHSVIDFAPLIVFGLLAGRIGMVVALTPVFGGTWAPAQIKVGLTVVLAAMLAPLVPLP